MVKEEIVEGLRQAVSKGESLEKAMISFYNAGYLKEDIEEAARALAAPTFSQAAGIQQQQRTQIQGTQTQQLKPLPLQTQYPHVVQRVSDYGKEPSKRGLTITILLFILLLFLFGILTAVILFKDELLGFFS